MVKKGAKKARKLSEKENSSVDAFEDVVKLSRSEGKKMKKSLKRGNEGDSSAVQVKQRKVEGNSKPEGGKFVKMHKGKRNKGYDTMPVAPGKKKPNLRNRDAKKLIAIKKEENNDSTTQESGKPNWQEVKEQRKFLRAKRKERKNEEGIFELSQNVKQMWEKLRRDDTSAEDRFKLSKDIFESLKGKIKKVAFAHDTVRVLECLVTQDNVPVKEGIFSELKSDLVELSKSAYGHFLVLKFLRHGTKEQKKAILGMFSGQATTFFKHKIASTVLETAYNDFANSAERNRIIQEFFGSEFRLFKDDSISSMNDIFSKYPERKQQIIKSLGENIQCIVEKSILHHSLAQTLIHRYFSCCSVAEMRSIATSIKEHLVQLIHTRDGSKVAAMCVWNSGTKDRKVIMKSLKGHVVKLCKHEHGHLLLLALFDTVDDTVLMKKIILPEILENVQELADDTQGKKILLYLVAPRDPRYCHPTDVEFLSQGDENPYSKKTKEQRQQELRTVVIDALLSVISEDMKNWMVNSRRVVIVQAILNNCTGEKLSEAFMSVASAVVQPFEPSTDNLIENAASHMVLKDLIRKDKERAERGEELFSKAVLDQMTPDICINWVACNRGAFLLLNMVETGIKEVKDKVHSLLKTNRKGLNKYNSCGQTLLIKKLFEVE